MGTYMSEQCLSGKCLIISMHEIPERSSHKLQGFAVATWLNTHALRLDCLCLEPASPLSGLRGSGQTACTLSRFLSLSMETGAVLPSKLAVRME